MDRGKTSVGIIGLGSISEQHIKSVKNIDGADIKMVCDCDKKRAEDIGKLLNCEYTVDYKRLINNAQIDVVHILTPHYLHTPMIVDALKAGKNVVVEKPLAISKAQISILKSADKRWHDKVGVTLQNRYNPTSLSIRELINNDVITKKKLGRLISVKSIVTWHRSDDYYNKSDWRGISEKEGGGVLINQAIHTIDLMAWTVESAAGKIKAVKGHVTNHLHPDIEVEDTALATFYYENGTVGNLYATNNNGRNSNIEMEWVFENGCLILRDFKLFLMQDGQTSILAEDNIAVGNNDYWGASHKICIADFYDSFRKGIPTMITLKEGISTNEIVLAIYESSRLNQVIEL